VNLWDDRSAKLEDVLPMVRRVWAVATEPHSGFEWVVNYCSDITAETPGAIPMTVIMP
jgi:hypothetical protein